jgi:hypothetical protein
MTNLVPLNKNQLPFHLRKSPEQARAVASELASGVTAGFPIISYRGKVWRVRKGGTEVDFLDRRGNAVPSIDVVFVKSNKNLSKTYYKGKWQEGDNSPPDCWSSDGVKPDAAVQNKQHTVCATCPRNAWGSRITEQGKKGRECSDVRRMAVVFADELAKKGADAHVFLMRIPPASLNPLKDYAEKVLGPAGVEYYAVATQVGFDSGASHPKLTFRVSTDEDDHPRFLTEEEYATIEELRDSPEVEHILSEEPDYASAGTTGEGDAAAPAPEATPAPVKAPSKPKPRPVDDEDVPTVAAPLAPVVEPTDDEDEDDDGTAAAEAALAAAKAAAAAAKKAKKKAATKPSAPAPAPAADEDDAPAPAAAPAAKGGFDDILESLLGGK